MLNVASVHAIAVFAPISGDLSWFGARGILRGARRGAQPVPVLRHLLGLDRVRPRLADVLEHGARAATESAVVDAGADHRARDVHREPGLALHRPDRRAVE